MVGHSTPWRRASSTLALKLKSPRHTSPACNNQSDDEDEGLLGNSRDAIEPFWRRARNKVRGSKSPKSGKGKATSEPTQASLILDPVPVTPICSSKVQLLATDADGAQNPEFRTCWLKLWPGSLCWHSVDTDNQEREVLGRLFFDSDLTVGPLPDVDHNCCFEVSGRDQRIVVRCDLEGEARPWIVCLNAAGLQVKDKCNRGEWSFVYLNIYKLKVAQKADKHVHAGVDVYGKEYSFSGEQGITECNPKKSPRHVFQRSYCLGLTYMKSGDLQLRIAALRHSWCAQDYDLKSNNCVTFCHELCWWIGVVDLLNEVEDSAWGGKLHLPGSEPDVADSLQQRRLNLAVDAILDGQTSKSEGRFEFSLNDVEADEEPACTGFVEIKSSETAPWIACCLKLWTGYLDWTNIKSKPASRGQFYLVPPCNISRIASDAGACFEVVSRYQRLLVRCNLEGEARPWIVCLSAAVKQVAERCNHKDWSYVFVNVYDLSQDRRVGLFNWFSHDLLNRGGAFHTGVQVYDWEYTFGGIPESADPKEVQSGVSVNPPREAPGHTFRQAICLGMTHLPFATVKEHLVKLEEEWPAQGYDILQRNCVTFCRELCRRMGLKKEVPGWVDSLVRASGEHALLQEQTIDTSSINFEVYCPIGHDCKLLSQNFLASLVRTLACVKCGRSLNRREIRWHCDDCMLDICQACGFEESI